MELSLGETILEMELYLVETLFGMTLGETMFCLELGQTMSGARSG